MRDAERHCWRAAQRLMHAAEIREGKKGRGRRQRRPLRINIDVGTELSEHAFAGRNSVEPGHLDTSWLLDPRELLAEVLVGEVGSFATAPRLSVREACKELKGPRCYCCLRHRLARGKRSRSL